MDLRSTSALDQPWIESFLREHWGADFIVSREQKKWPAQHEGLIAEENGRPLGLLTYAQEGEEIEILTFDAFNPFHGVGSFLLNQLKRVAHERNVRRVWLITSNDNLEAIRFYQRKGFDLCEIHRNAITNARKLKPSIPMMGSFGIPIAHEIELELILK